MSGGDSPSGVAPLPAALTGAAAFRDVLDHELAGLLARAHADHDARVAAVGRWTLAWRERVSASHLAAVVDGLRAQALYSELADSVISALARLTVTLLAGTNGRILRGRFVILGYGKLGSREMTPTSDLDLVFVYEVPGDVDESDAISALAPSAYYARLGQRLIRALTLSTGGRAVYDIDMRLRPHGDSGPIASSLEGFRRYYQKDAWTWEHMALTRARVVAGDSDLGAKIYKEIARILTSARDQNKLVTDVADMRRRIAAQHRPSSPWDVKYRYGGLIDIEFIAQYGQLLHGPSAPGVLSNSTADALRRLRDLGYFDASMSDTLIQALTFWQQVQSAQRAMKTRETDGAPDQQVFDHAISSVAHINDAAERMRVAEATAAAVRSWYEHLIEAPAATAPPAG